MNNTSNAKTPAFKFQTDEAVNFVASIVAPYNNFPNYTYNAPEQTEGLDFNVHVGISRAQTLKSHGCFLVTVKHFFLMSIVIVTRSFFMNGKAVSVATSLGMNR